MTSAKESADAGLRNKYSAEGTNHTLTNMATQTLAFNQTSIDIHELIYAYVKEERVSTIEKSIEVNVPEYVAYNQRTCFEEFPWFMEGVKEVKQLAPKRLHWKAEMTGQNTEWDAEITEQTAEQRLTLTY